MTTAANQIAQTSAVLVVLAGGGEPAGNPPEQTVVVDATTQENPPQVNPADEEAAIIGMYPDDPKMNQFRKELKGVDEAIKANQRLLADPNRPNEDDLRAIAADTLQNIQMPDHVRKTLTPEKFLLNPNAQHKVAAVWEKSITDALKILEENRAGIIIAKMKPRILQKEKEDAAAMAKAEEEAMVMLRLLLGEEEPSIPVAAPASPEELRLLNGMKLLPNLQGGKKEATPSTASETASAAVDPGESADLQRKLQDFVRLNGDVAKALPNALRQADFYLGHKGFTPLQIALSLRLLCIVKKSEVLQLAKQARAEGYSSYADLISDRFIRPLDKVISAINLMIEKVFGLKTETFQIVGGRAAIQARLNAKQETHLAPKGGGEYVEGLLCQNQELWETLFPEFEDYAAARKKIDLERKTADAAQKKAADAQRTEHLNRRLDMVKRELNKLLNDQGKVDNALIKVTDSDLEGENFDPQAVARRLAGIKKVEQEKPKESLVVKPPTLDEKKAGIGEIIKQMLNSITGINHQWWIEHCLRFVTKKNLQNNLAPKQIMWMMIDDLLNEKNISDNILDEAVIIENALGPRPKRNN